MTLGRPPMATNGFITTFPQAIDDRNLSASISFSSPSGVQSQVEISLTSFFVEAIKLWELTESIIKALYPNTTARYKSNLNRLSDAEENYESGFDILVNLETVWNKLRANLPQELRWSTDATRSSNTLDELMPGSETKSECLETQRKVLHTRYTSLEPYSPPASKALIPACPVY